MSPWHQRPDAVDPDDADLAAEVQRRQRLDDEGARRDLLARSAGVLEVDEDRKSTRLNSSH